jgi:superfamily II DNA helicase RecQ
VDKEGARFIVYCHKAKASEGFMEFLNLHSEETGVRAMVYHAKLERHHKEMAYARWKSGECKVLVRTGAIGAGMDYAHVRGV